MIYEGTTIVEKRECLVVFNTDEIAAMVKNTTGNDDDEKGTVSLYLKSGSVLDIVFDINLFRQINNCMIRRNINEIKSLEGSVRQKYNNYSRGDRVRKERFDDVECESENRYNPE